MSFGDETYGELVSFNDHVIDIRDGDHVIVGYQGAAHPDFEAWWDTMGRSLGKDVKVTIVRSDVLNVLVLRKAKRSS